MITMSPAAASAPISPNVLLATIAIIIILIIAYAFARYRKYAKIFSAAIIITIVVIAGIAAIWYAEANINYWFVAPYTTAGQDNSLDIYCENTGHLAATFNLVLSYTNAHFSQKSSLPYQLIDQRTVKYTFTLQPGQTQITKSWFIIDQNVTDFYLYLKYQQNPGNYLTRASPGGVDTASYQKDAQTGNFTVRIQAPPP